MNNIINTTSFKLDIQTIQSSIIKTVVESIKDILNDVPILCSPEGLKLLSVNPSRNILVHSFLDASKFTYFKCSETFIIGVNVLNLYKIIKTIEYNDILRIFITENEPHKLGIVFENKNTKTTIISYLHLLDLEYENMPSSITSEDYNISLSINTTYFQKICRDMSNFSDKIEIKVYKNQLILNCSGEFCERKIIRNYNNLKNETIDEDSNENDEENTGKKPKKGKYKKKKNKDIVLENEDEDVENIGENIDLYSDINNNEEQLEQLEQLEHLEQDKDNNENENNNCENEDDNEIIQGVFYLKHLCLFTKCTNLSRTIQLHLKNDYPLIIEYDHILGNMKLCLSSYKND